MNILNKNDIEIIESNGLVEYLRQVQHGYKRASTHSQDVIAHRIVEQTTEAKYPMNWGCAKCIFDLYKTLSIYYFKAIEKNNQDKTDKKNGQMEKKNARQQPTNTNSNATTATRQSSTRVKRKGKKNSSN